MCVRRIYIYHPFEAWVPSRKALPLHNALYSPPFITSKMQRTVSALGPKWDVCANLQRPITAHVVRYATGTCTSKDTSCLVRHTSEEPLVSRILTIIVWTTNPLTAILSRLVRAKLERSYARWFCTLPRTSSTNQPSRKMSACIQSFGTLCGCA